ncbi:mechanosensitive ion channel protein MscS [Lentibacillus kapialis]|uniref:Mechanosensitive ion channel protein MscS n=1 Tax=Lentibacillus kapialis TaxID=340214 RepID=A0A917UVL8_9BACI|nr:mechanosensitive ion channel family protein [Lentibacillus kapialis]GGJ89677.1 mechanosensitive ion channel protein MscS [Lentibacillus kapialis]
MDFVNGEFVDLWDYITGPKLWLGLGEVLFKAIAIIVIALVIVRIGNKVIGRIFESRTRGPLRITERREVTIKKLIQNSMKYTVYFVAFIMVLDDAFGFDVGALLAGAGVAGLAIGFGAQNLVRDIISGFFIIFEDQFSVGDYIFTAGVEGYVEEIGMRTTKIESWTGEQYVVPNGNVTQVTNYSIHNGLAIVDVNVPYENDVAAAEEIIGDVISTLPDKHEEIVKVPEIFGVQALDTSHFVLRVVAETLPSYQWKGARNIRKEIKEVLYKEGIQIPAPRLIMYSRNQEHDSQEVDRQREM